MVLTMAVLGCADASDPASEATSGSETETDGDTGASCTDEDCDSTLTLTLQHQLPLLEGPHQITMTTPLFDVDCSIPTELTGSDSCFGFRFADLDWDESTITITLIEPYYDTDLNPEALPFETVGVLVTKSPTVLYDETVTIDPGQSTRPDPCGPVCWPATGSATLPPIP
jgi:hypothetical protein